MVTLGLTEMEISILRSVLMLKNAKKKPNSPPRPAKSRIKLGLPIYNSEVPDTTGRKKRRRTQAITKAFFRFMQTQLKER